MVPAAPERAYAILADYRNGHPRILPPQFSGLTVEAGGRGAGTIVRFQMTAFGKKQTFRAAITEPEPGRVLVEKDLESNGAVTTFRVDPGGSAKECRVTITTEMPRKPGLSGALERLFTGWYLRPIYRRELQQLAAVAAE